MTTRAHITVVVDRSGSMHLMREEAEGGLRAFVKEQAALTDVKIKLSLFQFDTLYERVYGPVKIDRAPEYQLEPRGATALYDAVGNAIADTDQAIGAAKVNGKEPDKVVVVIVTDGKENSSREHTFESVSKLVKDRKKAGWEFVFLAGDLKAVEFGRAVGMKTTAYDGTKRGETIEVYTVASAGTASYLSGQTRTVETPDELPREADDGLAGVRSRDRGDRGMASGDPVRRAGDPR